MKKEGKEARFDFEVDLKEEKKNSRFPGKKFRNYCSLKNLQKIQNQLARIVLLLMIFL